MRCVLARTTDTITLTGTVDSDVTIQCLNDHVERRETVNLGDEPLGVSSRHRG